MKKSHLRKIIKEEIKSVLTEAKGVLTKKQGDVLITLLKKVVDGGVMQGSSTFPTDLKNLIRKISDKYYQELIFSKKSDIYIDNEHIYIYTKKGMLKLWKVLLKELQIKQQ